MDNLKRMVDIPDIRCRRKQYCDSMISAGLWLTNFYLFLQLQIMLKSPQAVSLERRLCSFFLSHFILQLQSPPHIIIFRLGIRRGNAELPCFFCVKFVEILTRSN